MDSTSSVNAVFLATGPSAGVLRHRSSSDPHNAPTDASLVLSECLDAVCVPADQYWRAAARAESADGASRPLPFALTVRRPDPLDMRRSFYTARTDAVAHRRYAPDGGVLVLAAECRGGSSAKHFTVMQRAAVAPFIAAIPQPPRRSLYVLLDEAAAVDPFFDIDCRPPFAWGAGTPTLGMVEQWLNAMLRFLCERVERVTGAKVRRCLVLTSSVILCDREDAAGNAPSARGAEEDENARLETSPHKRRGKRETVKQEEERDPSAAAQAETEGWLSEKDTKLSFHVHFRLDRRTAFANIRVLHAFMTNLRDELDASLANSASQPPPLVHRIVRQCVDFGVYSRWRAFRLPYCVKAETLAPLETAALDLSLSEAGWTSNSNPTHTSRAPNAATPLKPKTTPTTSTKTTLVSTTTTTRTTAAAAASAATKKTGTASVLLSAVLPDVRVGAAAPAVAIYLNMSTQFAGLPRAQQEQQWRSLTRLFCMFRFLLPIVPGRSALTDRGLIEFLTTHPIEFGGRPSRCSSLPRGVRAAGSGAKEESDETLTAKAARDGEGSNTDVTHCTDAPHSPFVQTVFDLAFVQRDRRQREAECGETAENSALAPSTDAHGEAVVRLVPLSAMSAPSAPSPALRDPFSVPRPPIRDGARQAVHDMRLRGLIAEVFRCLHAAYDDPTGDAASRAFHTHRGLTPSLPRFSAERVTVQYQDGLRAYYAQQKQSRFCLRLQRTHRATFPHLYLTYGSIKVRCYSNDCCGGCLVVPWDANDVNTAEDDTPNATRDRRQGEQIGESQVEANEYPKYARLAEIRQILFPELPLEELLKRYGASVLQKRTENRSDEQ